MLKILKSLFKREEDEQQKRIKFLEMRLKELRILQEISKLEGQRKNDQIKTENTFSIPL